MYSMSSRHGLTLKHKHLLILVSEDHFPQRLDCGAPLVTCVTLKPAEPWVIFILPVCEQRHAARCYASISSSAGVLCHQEYILYIHLLASIRRHACVCVFVCAGTNMFSVPTGDQVQHKYRFCGDQSPVWDQKTILKTIIICLSTGKFTVLTQQQTRCTSR